MSARPKTNPPAAAGAPAPPFEQTSPAPTWLLCLLLALATLAIYSPVAWNGYVDYDDGDYVMANPHIQHGLRWSTVAWAFTTGHASNWHPLTWLSHALDFQLFGPRPGAQHLVSLALHIANTLLLFLLLRRLTGAPWRSALAAAFFALHPLHVESVAWISERKDVLSGFFFLLTLLAYRRYVGLGHAPAPENQNPNNAARISSLKVRSSKPKVKSSQSSLEPPAPSPQPPALAHGSLSYYALALVCLALGLMSKPMLVSVPFVLLLLDYWPLRRLEADFSLRRFAALAIEKLPFFALGAASCVVTFQVQKAGGAVATALPWDVRLPNAVVSYARYLGKTFWPVRLSVLYPHPGHWPLWEVVGAAVLLAIVSAAVVWQARKRPWLAVGWFWFFGMLVPVVGLVQVGIQSMADRYMYLPIIGLLLMLLWGIPMARAPRSCAVAAAGASALALCACAALTVRQVLYWHDSQALFQRAVAATDRNYLAYNNLGFFLANQGKLAEALEYYQLSTAIKPDYEDALNNIGHALAGLKKPAEALPYYEAALRTRPENPEVNNNYGNALSDLGRLDEAIQHYRLALKRRPDYADAHNDLGIALAMQGKFDEAESHLQQAIRLNPADASAHGNLGNTLALQRRFAEAVQQYQLALQLKPNEAQTHYNLATALSGLGRLDEAVAHYHEALRLDPANAGACANLAAALLTQGKLAAASAQFQAALRLRPDSPELHCGLAQTLYRQGLRDQAAAHLAEALRLKPDLPEARQLLDAIRAAAPAPGQR